MRQLLNPSTDDPDQGLNTKLIQVLDDAQWCKTHFLARPPSPGDVQHAEHFLNIQRDQQSAAVKYQLSVLEKRHREKMERLKQCLKYVHHTKLVSLSC